MRSKLHYGWIVIFIGLLTTIAAHDWTHSLHDPSSAMKDGLKFDYTQRSSRHKNFIGYLT
jgi:hypothetical protein